MTDDMDMLKLITDHMETGFLENIIDMFKHQPEHFRHLGGMISDHRGAVRLGTVALVEVLLPSYRKQIAEAVPGIINALGAENPTARADAAYLLGVIGIRDTAKAVKAAADKEDNPIIRDALQDAAAELEAEGD